MNESSDVLQSVRKALGRTSPLQKPPTPPVIDERITRLVHTEIGLAELFIKTAKDNKMSVAATSPEEIAEQLIAFLKSKNVRSIAMSVSPLLEQLEILPALKKAGFDVRTWDQMSLDNAYDVDCGITDVWKAVAEVGALVIRGSENHGRVISLTPPIHVAIVEPKNLVPDLVDLFQQMPADQNDKIVIITGPSKTSDIEMTLVTGVHGPTSVQLFVLQ